jgi:glycerophosphoryl diester phosphodiesterase
LIPLPKHLTYQGKEVLLKYHKLLSGSGKHDANSLSALREVLEGRVAVLEFDVNYLADGDFALIHDGTLQRETTGAGSVRRLTGTEFKALKYRDSDEHGTVLSDMVSSLKNSNFPLKVQVDFKERAPITNADAQVLLKAIEPLRENGYITVVIGCLADWNLRTFRRLDPTVDIGLDFALHLDAPVDGMVRLPTCLGAYGYLDDHPLALRRLQTTEAYLRDRVETLIALAPNAYEFYLRSEFIVQALDDGFNPVAFIHEQLPGSRVDVWTIDYGSEEAEVSLKKALEAGVDQVTTNTSLQWFDYFS